MDGEAGDPVKIADTLGQHVKPVSQCSSRNLGVVATDQFSLRHQLGDQLRMDPRGPQVKCKYRQLCEQRLNELATTFALLG